MEVYGRETMQNNCKIAMVSAIEEKFNNEMNSLKNYGFNIITAKDFGDAAKKIDSESADLLLIDSSMCKNFDNDVSNEICSITKNIYTILLVEKECPVPSFKTMKELNIKGYCEKSGNCDQLFFWIESGMQTVFQKREMQKMNEELIDTRKELEKNYLESIETLRHMVDAKDRYTRGHSDRVAEYASLIGKRLGLSKKDLKNLHVGGLFHDIGKIGIPDNILLKSTKLSDLEYLKIKNHASIGAQILANASSFKDIIPIVKHHHERFDGNGYPDGLAGEDIPLMARITSVADAFDAMYSKRIYSDKMDLDTVINEIVKCRRTQFDPLVVDAFVDIVKNDMGAIRYIQEKF